MQSTTIQGYKNNKTEAQGHYCEILLTILGNYLQKPRVAAEAMAKFTTHLAALAEYTLLHHRDILLSPIVKILKIRQIYLIIQIAYL